MERLHYSILDPMSIPVDYFDLNLETLRLDHERDEVSYGVAATELGKVTFKSLQALKR